MRVLRVARLIQDLPILSIGPIILVCRKEWHERPPIDSRSVPLSTINENR